MPLPLNYRTPEVTRRPASQRRVRTSAAVCVLNVLTINIALVMLAAGEPHEGFGAFIITMFVVPLTNLALVIISVCLIPVVRRFSGGASTDAYFMASILAPAVIGLFTFLCCGSLVG
jgi:hypothetical protein